MSCLELSRPTARRLLAPGNSTRFAARPAACGQDGARVRLICSGSGPELRQDGSPGCRSPSTGASCSGTRSAASWRRSPSCRRGTHGSRRLDAALCLREYSPAIGP
jgi:hypothetical protein